MFTLPFALVGGIWFIYLLGYNMSVAVGVGFIALAGVSAELGVVMLTYLDQALESRRRDGRLDSSGDLVAAVIEGASRRVRPIFMTVGSTVGGLLPIMWASGTGSQVMKRIAAPMVGGLATATLLVLLVLPAVYALWRGLELRAGTKPTTDTHTHKEGVSAS
jgi:Cu(I)/Ag(I) efflux system membrane protein CusA/SilA